MNNFQKDIELSENSLLNIRGIFDDNKIKDRILFLNSEILKKDFWKDSNQSKKVVKEKNFLENILNFYLNTEKELNNLKDLNKLALDENDSDRKSVV